jgi:hypothetical protein
MERGLLKNTTYRHFASLLLLESLGIPTLGCGYLKKSEEDEYQS